MAEPEVQISQTQASSDLPGDVEMGGAEDGEAGEGAEATGGIGDALPGTESDQPKRMTFLDYLKSPIVELVVGRGDSQTVLTAHQALLVRSPFFEEACAQFEDGSKPRRIELPDEDLEATGSLLEYLYNGEYFPRRTGDSRDGGLEPDPAVPATDDQGVGLLKHARVYTLATKFGLPALRSLAHAKIHRTTSTARGEIAYARFVYKETSKEDATIRKPVAAFWATRSHVLRHEAEDEFRAMCLEFPQFGFDVLSLVLDQRERKGERHDPGQGGPGDRSARKRARLSQV